MDHAKINEIRRSLIQERLKSYHRDCENGARLYVGAAVYSAALCLAFVAIALA